MRDSRRLVRMRLPILGPVWVTTNYADTHAVLGDAATFVRNPATAGGRPPERVFWWTPPFVRPLLRNVTLMDGADHARLRKLVTQAFSTRGIDAMRPKLAEIAGRLLDDLPKDQETDLIAGYTRQLPMLAICELLGVPEADREKVARWIEPISRVSGIATFFRAAPGLYKVSRYFRSDFDVVRATRRPGLIRELVEAREGTDRLSDDELLAMVVALFIGGFDTTTHLIGNGAMTLMQRPDIAQALRDDPQGWTFFIEEVMRFHSPVMFTNMFHVAKDTDLGGQRLRRGERIVPLLIAANRDPERFADVGSFDPKRRPNRHLGFGYGTHMCIGMQLARAEAQVALQTLFGRYPEVALTRPVDQVPMLKRLGLRGMAQLPVRLRG